MLTRRTVAAALCALPQWRCFAADTLRTLTVPARLDRELHILIPVSVNGSDPLWSVLDTGGGAQMYLSREQADALHIEATGRGRSAGPQDQTLRKDGRARVTIETGGVRLTDQPLVIKDTPIRNDGVVGAGLFASAVVEIDYQAPAVTFHPASTFRYEAAGAPIPLELWEQRPQVAARLAIDGDRETSVRLTVDTGGNGAAVYLTRDFADELRRGGRGPRWMPDFRSMESAWIDRLTVGPFRLDHARVRRLPVRNFGPSPGAPDGLLGLDFLTRYRIYLDYRRRRMYLEPYARGERL